MTDGSEGILPPALDDATGDPGRPRRPGLPWEADDPGRSAAGVLETVRVVLFSPTEAFQSMRRSGDVGGAIAFLLIGGTFGSFFGLLWQAAARTMLGSFGGVNFGEIAIANTIGVIWFIFAPVAVLVFAVVITGIYHLSLLVFGGAPHPPETTLKTVCYAAGANYIWLAMPLCGGLVATLWGIVSSIIGLREAQEVPAGRAAAAVLVPYVLVCCCLLLSLLVFGAAIGALVGAVGG